MTTTNEMAVGTKLMLRGRDFIVTEQTESVYGTLYVLKGARGASYGTMRNRNNPDRMFLVNLRGFGIAAGYEGLWLSDKSGKIEVVAR